MAVSKVIEFARQDGHTLVIVTADHETGGLSLQAGKSQNPLEAKWTTGGHTAADVPIFAFGPGSETFSGVIDNIEIPRRIAELTGITQFPVQKSKTAAKTVTLKTAATR
jgi:alkaline phosphatase